MVKSALKLMTIVMVLFQITMVFTSCCDDDSQSESKPDVPTSGNIKYEVKDTSAGTFLVKNISSHESFTSVADVVPEDTLLIQFTPKQDYRNYSFAIFCNDLEQLNDSIYVVPRLGAGTHNIELSAADTIGNLIYSATKELRITIPESYIIIPMIVSVSADLQPLVNVELSYTDKNGDECKYLIGEEEWIKPDSASFYKYKSEDGHIHYSGRVPEGCEILEEERYAPNRYFILNTRFLNLTYDVTTTFTARYVPKANIELDRDSYEFTHGIDRQSARVSIPKVIVIDSYSSFNIDLTNHTVQKDNVMSYLEELSKNPDTQQFNLSTKGNITNANH